MREINPTRGVRKAPGKIQPRTPRAQAINLIREYQANPNLPMKRPGIRTVVHGGQSILEHLGLGGAAHPIRRVQSIPKGGPMVFPLGPKPKFPSWMGARIGPGVSVAEHARQLETGRIQEFISELDKVGKQTFFDKASPLVSHKYPLRTENRLAGTYGGYGLPKKQLIEALSQMNKNTPANKAFIRWMMTHHYKRPN